MVFFFFQAEDGIRDADVTGVQTCALPISGCPVHGSTKSVPVVQFMFDTSVHPPTSPINTSVTSSSTVCSSSAALIGGNNEITHISKSNSSVAETVITLTL